MRGAPECQVLFELFASPRGKVWLGRMGGDAGRIVLLRETNDAGRVELTRAVEVAAHSSHPKLLKVLGVVESQGRRFVASEYIPGASLFEIIAVVRKRQRAMMASSAVRIAIDALRLVAPARALSTAAGRAPGRFLHADCLWVTDYGETLLAEAGVSEHLVASANKLDAGSDAESQDLRTAAVELFHLASARLMTGDMVKMAKTHLPAPLARTLEGVFSWDLTSGFTSAEAFAADLAALPTILVGSEATVAEELQLLLADVLEERRRKLAQLSSAAGPRDTEGVTVVYRPPPSRGDPDGADQEEEATRPFALPRHGHSLRELKRVVPVEKPLEPERPPRPPNPVEVAKPPAATKPSGVSPSKHVSLPPRAAPRTVTPSARQRRVREIERVLLGVLAALLIVACALAIARPGRVRSLLESVKAAF
jgi:hypothetical protein